MQASRQVLWHLIAARLPVRAVGCSVGAVVPASRRYRCDVPCSPRPASSISSSEEKAEALSRRVWRVDGWSEGGGELVARWGGVRRSYYNNTLRYVCFELW